MQIRKVKSANGMILIRAEEASGEEDIRRIELESRAEPRPEFHEAMGGLIGPALDMIQAPLAWKHAATISGLSLTHEEERGIGAVVTLLVPLPCAPSPLTLNTPYLLSHLTGGPTLPDDLRQAIERVVDEALRYMDGERAQGDLFAGRPDDVPVDNPFDGMSVYRAITEHDADGVVDEQQSVAEVPASSDGPILDQPPAEVRAEFERIRAEAMRKQPGIKPARGRRLAKADS